MGNTAVLQLYLKQTYTVAEALYLNKQFTVLCLKIGTPKELGQAWKLWK